MLNGAVPPDLQDLADPGQMTLFTNDLALRWQKSAGMISPLPQGI